MVGGAGVAFWWGMFEPDVAIGLFGDQHLYEIVPGFAVCLVLAVVVSLITPQPPRAAMEEFDAMVGSLRSGRIPERRADGTDRKSTRLNSSHVAISYYCFCLKKI